MYKTEFMALYEELTSINTTTNITEHVNAYDAYERFMKVESYLEDSLGCEIISDHQTDEGGLMICLSSNNLESLLDDLYKYCDELEVDISIVNSTNTSYNYRIYLNC